MVDVTVRSDRVERVLTASCQLPPLLPDVEAVGLVGSYARGTARADSDVDLVVLTDNPAEMLGRTDWFAIFDPGAVLIRSRNFGAIRERRLRLPDGLTVEVGIGDPSWADTKPVDCGTRRVVNGGLVVLYDPQGFFATLTRLVSP